MMGLRHTTFWKIALVVVCGTWLGLHVVLPWYLTRVANRELDKIPGIDGQIERINFYLLNLSLVADKTTIQAKDDSFSTTLPQVRFSLDGSELVRFRLAGEIELLSPEFEWKEIPKAEAKATEQTELPKDPRFYSTGLRLRRLVPAVLQGFSIEDGSLSLVLQPQTLKVKDVQLILDNVATRRSKQKGPAQLKATATLPGEGKFETFGVFDPLDPYPDAKIEFKILDLKLASLAPLSRSLTKIDAEKGTLDAAGEIATTKGVVEGYIKPLFENVSVTEQRKGQGFWRTVWEHIVQGVVSIFENDETDKVAGKIRIRGDLTQPGVSFWDIFKTTFKNAFGEPLTAQYERSLKLKPTLPKKK